MSSGDRTGALPASEINTLLLARLLHAFQVGDRMWICSLALPLHPLLAVLYTTTTHHMQLKVSRVLCKFKTCPLEDALSENRHAG